MSKNVLLCGVGGQGTILASKLMAAAAMKKGMHVLSAETIGMSQRGGSVTSHMRIGDESLHSPLIGKGQADIILGFEPGEVVRNLPYLKKDGIVIANTRPVRPVTATLSGDDYNGLEMVEYLKSKNIKMVTVDSKQAIDDLGSAKVLNVVLLGAAVGSGVLDLTKEEIKEAIKDRVKPQFYELNMKAIDYVQV